MNYDQHRKLMEQICYRIERDNLPMVLKGGTALLFAYGLDRFSEDLDFDSSAHLNLDRLIKDSALACSAKIQAIDKIKDTETVRKYRVLFNEEQRLKIEVSFREPELIKHAVNVSGVKTYPIEILISQKLNALNDRTTARDLHDVVFLLNNYKKHFTEDNTSKVLTLYSNLNDTFSRFQGAFDNDFLLKGKFLDVLAKLEKLYHEHEKTVVNNVLGVTPQEKEPE